jgi:predicted nucleic acid-binding Zn ribbon protein
LPIYEYKCATCGKHFELMQSMSDEALTTCRPEFCVRDDGEEPGGGVVARVLFAPAIHFKGTGFHNTDYGRRSRPGEDGGSGDGKKDGAKDGAKEGAKDGGSKEKAASAGSSGKTVGLDKV